jgi:SNF2 family DNA or RNA helicase
LQAEDRIHRIGQKSSAVRIVYAIAEGSADDIVWEQIQKKHSVVGATVGKYLF